MGLRHGLLAGGEEGEGVEIVDNAPSPPAYRQAGIPLPCLRRSGFAQAGVKGEGELDRINVYLGGYIKH
jgi:hypothetical protein